MEANFHLFFAFDLVKCCSCPSKTHQNNFLGMKYHQFLYLI